MNLNNQYLDCIVIYMGFAKKRRTKGGVGKWVGKDCQNEMGKKTERCNEKDIDVEVIFSH